MRDCKNPLILTGALGTCWRKATILKNVEETRVFKSAANWKRGLKRIYTARQKNTNSYVLNQLNRFNLKSNFLFFYKNDSYSVQRKKDSHQLVKVQP